jgi:hypothetical protein
LQNATSPLLICSTEKGIDEFDFFGKKLYERVFDKKIQPNIKPLLYKEKHLCAVLEANTNNLFLIDVIENKLINTEIKLTKLPNNYTLINNEKPYLIGFYGNKVLCIKQ